MRVLNFVFCASPPISLKTVWCTTAKERSRSKRGSINNIRKAATVLLKIVQCEGPGQYCSKRPSAQNDLVHKPHSAGRPVWDPPPSPTLPPFRIRGQKGTARLSGVEIRKPVLHRLEKRRALRGRPRPLCPPWGGSVIQ